ncbi:MOSC domain-containing protein [Haloplanus ruber]|uniref:MOSC domain-containing protein n=1 Tax=Haloplanus ruber TaxID=869892 RepID=A0ABD6D031_9EURY|nr:MOSC domain-containing protein [Haloplanus ruber]
MDGTGTAERIFTAPDAGAPMETRSEVEAVAGRGLRGDRYFSENETGTFVSWEQSEARDDGYDLTLIEAEAIDAIARDADIELDSGEHRRNVVTRDAALNHLVDTRFRVGDAICRGDRLCEPCHYLQDLVGADVLDALAHRGGLRADILVSGTIRPGDTVEPLE